MGKAPAPMSSNRPNACSGYAPIECNNVFAQDHFLPSVLLVEQQEQL